MAEPGGLGARSDLHGLIWPPAVLRQSAAYQDVLGLDVLMDMGWIITYGSQAAVTVQISVMSEGGSGTPVPDLSIEVDDLEQRWLA
jgi:hypothetical protein